MHLVTSNSTPPARDRLLDLPKVEDVAGVKKSKLYALIREKKFPAPIKLGTRTARWPESKVLAWVQAQVQAAEQTEQTGQSQ